MPNLFRYFKKWLLALSFKTRPVMPESPSGEIKVTNEDALNALVRGFEDNKPAVQREQWFQSKNDLMDADFDLYDVWNNHPFIPFFDKHFPTEIRVEGIGKFTDEVERTKYEPHKDNPKMVARYSSGYLSRDSIDSDDTPKQHFTSLHDTDYHVHHTENHTSHHTENNTDYEHTTDSTGHTDHGTGGQED